MLPLILGGLAVAGGIISAIGAHEDAEAQEAAAKENARLARLAAADAMQRGTTEAGRARMEGSRVIGEQKALFGASGIDPSVGSPLALMADSRLMSELDAATIQNNAAREAWGLRTQAAQFKREAAAANTRGKFAVASSILGGVSQGAGIYYGGTR